MANPDIAIKIHSYTTDSGFEPHPGFPSCDFRGPDWIGSPQGDEHHCLRQWNNPSDAFITLVLAEGPNINKKAKEFEDSFDIFKKIEGEPGVGSLIDFLGGIPRVRIGVWDKRR